MDYHKCIFFMCGRVFFFFIKSKGTVFLYFPGKVRFLPFFRNIEWVSENCVFFSGADFFSTPWKRVSEWGSNFSWRNFRSKICSYWPFWGVIFDNFGGQKSRFLHFFILVLESFRKFLSIVFGLKRSTFECIFSSKGA